MSVAIFQTTKGTIRVQLFDDKTPKTVENFVKLTEQGYYNGLSFHRVIADFMIQGGCPKGTGTGGPGYTFADEFHPTLKHDKPGILSMANSGPNTNGSQFFITHVPTPWLDNKHSVFGAVIDAPDVVNSIQQGHKIYSLTITKQRGVEPSDDDDRCARKTFTSNRRSPRIQSVGFFFLQFYCVRQTHPHLHRISANQAAIDRRFHQVRAVACAELDAQSRTVGLDRFDAQ